MPRGWEGNHRSGVALAMRHGLSGLSTSGLNGQRMGDEHPTSVCLNTTDNHRSTRRSAEMVELVRVRVKVKSNECHFSCSVMISDDLQCLERPRDPLPLPKPLAVRLPLPFDYCCSLCCLLLPMATCVWVIQ